MDHRIPEPLKALVEQLARLPGLGPKSAMRVAMTLTSVKNVAEITGDLLVREG